MAWPSGREQHLLVPQQCWRNAEGDRPGDFLLCDVLQLSATNHPGLLSAGSLQAGNASCLNRNCRTFWSNVRKTLIDQGRIIIKSLKISLLWGWTFTITQTSSKSPEGWVVICVVWGLVWKSEWDDWGSECHFFARLFIALISLFGFLIFLVEFDLKTDINKISVILAGCWSSYSSSHNGGLWNIYHLCFLQSKLQAYPGSGERCRKSLLQEPSSVWAGGVEGALRHLWAWLCADLWAAVSSLSSAWLSLTGGSFVALGKPEAETSGWRNV